LGESHNLISVSSNNDRLAFGKGFAKANALRVEISDQLSTDASMFGSYQERIGAIVTHELGHHRWFPLHGPYGTLDQFFWQALKCFDVVSRSVVNDLHGGNTVTPAIFDGFFNEFLPAFTGSLF